MLENCCVVFVAENVKIIFEKFDRELTFKKVRASLFIYRCHFIHKFYISDIINMQTSTIIGGRRCLMFTDNSMG